MEFDNQGTSEPWKNGNRTDISDFSDPENAQGDKKNRKDKSILGAKKKEKDKSKKETRYATLGDDSSGDEDGKKKAKKKGFQFGSTKKEKKEKKERDSKETKDSKKKEKKDKEKDKDKPKLKLKKLKPDGDVEGKVEEVPVFGVPLELAVERSRCHDGIKLPVVVRECIDFIEENGLRVEGIYRSSGVKSKVNKLRVAYNTRQSVSLAGSEPAVVASLLKLFLRELPDPVLTQQLIPRFEELANKKDISRIQPGLKALLQQLPECNLRLLEWIFVHMGHVIQQEKHNKMTLQNVSIVLSPTMQISHRVLYSLFHHSASLFGHVTIKKYIPPISGQGGVNLLPESPEGIEEEMKKQESLLEDLHKEISLGVASKAAEEQLWEQQRIVTQLKRKLRLAKCNNKDETKQDQDEELNFSLQTPLSASKLTPENIKSQTEPQPIPVESDKKPESKDCLSSPEEKGDNGQEHRVTVQIHQADNLELDRGHVTVIKLAKKETTPPKPTEQLETSPNLKSVDEEDNNGVDGTDINSTNKSGLLPRNLEQTFTPNENIKPTLDLPDSVADSGPQQPGTSSDLKLKKVDFKEEESGESAKKKELINSKALEEQTRTPEDGSRPEKDGSGSKPFGIPLLPPPPTSSKPSSRGLLKPTLAPQLDTRMKSKSLPRGLPSDISNFRTPPERKSSEPDQSDRKVSTERERLLWEELSLKFKYEELLNLKSELERRKKTERREVNELQEEIATMQTLYQYRTYSIDSSEESDVEEELEQVQADKRILLRQLMKEQTELEQKKLFLLTKLQDERTACLELRVQIRLEQERLKRRGL